MTFTCPRRIEDGMHRDDSPHKLTGSNKDVWRDDNTCSYCGSLNQDEFMKHLEAGDVELTPTDKSYKVYVEGIPNPDAGRPTIYSSANFPQSGEGWVQITKKTRKTLPSQAKYYPDGHYVQVEPARATLHHKFYFQHLAQEQRVRFVELLNAGKLRLMEPGYFYVPPFFCKAV
jgi:hypothetical protein